MDTQLYKVPRDLNSIPLPHYKNPSTDQPELVEGKNGAMKSLIAGDDGTLAKVSADGSINTNGVSQQYVTPTEVQARYSQMFQTHANQAILGTSTSNANGFIDCDGFDEICAIVLNDINTTNTEAYVRWSIDGISDHGAEIILPSGLPVTGNGRVGSTKVKARYAKLAVYNTDSAPHTMTAWVTLKA
jgi:hypothetical protein